MPSPGKKRDTGCPFAFALDTFGDRWSLLVVRDLLLKKGRNTFGDFLDGDEGFATNILADRLKYLESEGIVGKARDPDNRRRYIYSLTEKGFDLAPIMVEIIRWSGKYDPRTHAPKKVLERIENDRDGFVAELRSRSADD